MKASRSRKNLGTPAAAILAGGISRHGRHCYCRYCRAEYAVQPVAQTAQSGADVTAIPNGTSVRLPDGTTALAYRDCGIGRPWDGCYVTAQILDGVERRDYGWRRDQLEVLP